MINNQQFAQSLNILAIFFRYPPYSAEFDSICQYFQTNWRKSWGVELSDTQDYSALENLNQLSRDVWKQYFGIEYNLYAPPWGSVYTDPEKVLYGETTIKLQDELSLLGLELCSGEKEPVDHISLILMVMANLALSNRIEYLKDFTSTHLAPWVSEYTSRLKENTHEEAILMMVELLKETLRNIPFMTSKNMA